MAQTHSGMPRGRVRTPAMLAAQIVQMAACAIVVAYAAAQAGLIRPAAALVPAARNAHVVTIALASYPVLLSELTGPSEG